VLRTIGKNAPRKVTNAIDSSAVGQKMIASGTQANGGMGRNVSRTGKNVCRNRGRDAISSPIPPPSASAQPNPSATRCSDSDQELQ